MQARMGISYPMHTTEIPILTLGVNNIRIATGCIVCDIK